MFVCRRGDGHSISGRKKWGIERTALDMMYVVVLMLDVSLAKKKNSLVSGKGNRP